MRQLERARPGNEGLAERTVCTLTGGGGQVSAAILRVLVLFVSPSHLVETPPVHLIMGSRPTSLIKVRPLNRQHYLRTLPFV